MASFCCLRLINFPGRAIAFVTALLFLAQISLPSSIYASQVITTVIGTVYQGTDTTGVFVSPGQSRKLSFRCRLEFATNETVPAERSAAVEDVCFVSTPYFAGC